MAQALLHSGRDKGDSVMVVTPLARRLVLMLTSFALVFALIWAGMMTYAHGLETRIARDWMDLVERCRTAIERVLI